MRAGAAGESPLLLLDVVAVLQARSVDYAVIGAMAAAVHGVVRASVDADAVLSIRGRDAAGLRDVFVEAGFLVDLRKGDMGDPIAAVLEITDAFANRVDLLIGLRGMDASLFSRAIEVPFGEEVLKVAGREDFIAMKLFAGGPQDLLDAKQASALPPAPDVQLIQHLVQSYGREAVSNFNAMFPGSTLP